MTSRRVFFWSEPCFVRSEQKTRGGGASAADYWQKTSIKLAESRLFKRETRCTKTAGAGVAGEGQRSGRRARWRRRQTASVLTELLGRAIMWVAPLMALVSPQFGALSTSLLLLFGCIPVCLHPPLPSSSLFTSPFAYNPISRFSPSFSPPPLICRDSEDDTPPIPRPDQKSFTVSLTCPPTPSFSLHWLKISPGCFIWSCARPFVWVTSVFCLLCSPSLSQRRRERTVVKDGRQRRAADKGAV